MRPVDDVLRRTWSRGCRVISVPPLQVDLVVESGAKVNLVVIIHTQAGDRCAVKARELGRGPVQRVGSSLDGRGWARCGLGFGPWGFRPGLEFDFGG